ncbi:MAG: trypsin-like serine protease [Elusimicrobiaceae bacterium]|nr:trypsin-like serine protease [Elusimicrobiaceae bacterium]
MKILWIFLLMMLTPLVWGQVSVLSVVSEDSHTKKEDFLHTFEYYAFAPNTKVSKCQATRIGKKWFVTAAHCVRDVCAKGCTLRLDLLEESISAFIDTKHSAKRPTIFMHPKYNPDVPVLYDFALLKIDLLHAPAQYYARAQGEQKENIAISQAQFRAFLNKNIAAKRKFNALLHPSFPPILVFEEMTRRIDRQLSVISIFNGKRNILHNPYPTDYVKELGFAYTKNFGVREGMSGSGVMTNTGELTGIISGYLGISGPQKKQEYFMFAVFNRELMDFMEKVMGSDYYKMDRKGAYPDYVRRSTINHGEVIDSVKMLSRGPKKIVYPI